MFTAISLFLAWRYLRLHKPSRSFWLWLGAYILVVILQVVTNLGLLEGTGVQWYPSNELWEIIKNITTLNNQLASLNAASSLHILDNELTTIEKDILPLTKQTPYTLLMMRVVEIGLPVLLSIFSIFFLLRYSLTEKRSQEMKNLLKQKNEERSKEANKATGSATV